MANIKKSYINDSGTLVQEMDDGSMKKFGAAGNVVDFDSSGNVVSNVYGGHTLGQDKKASVKQDDLDKETLDYLNQTFFNPKIAEGDKPVAADGETYGSRDRVNTTKQDYESRVSGGADNEGVLRGRGERVSQLVNQGAAVYYDADSNTVKIQTPDGSVADLSYSAAQHALRDGLIKGVPVFSKGEDTDDDTSDDTDTDDNNNVVQPSQPTAPAGVPASIEITPNQAEVEAAKKVFTDQGVVFPLGTSMPNTDLSPTLEGPSGTSETEIPTFTKNIQQQQEDFEKRAIEQNQNIKPQTLAEKTAAGTIGKLEQRLYRNSMGMNTYILGVYNSEGVWTPSQGIPQGYVQVKQDTMNMNTGGTVTVKDKDDNIVELDKSGMGQEQANLIGQAVVNPKENVIAAPVNQMTGEESGTVMPSTTGQASGVAPIVNNPNQVENVTTADTPDKKETETADLTTSKDDMKEELDNVNAQTGTVSKEIEAQTQDTTKVGDIEAAQGTATKVEDAPTRTLKEGELIDGSAVDQSKVSDIYGDKKLEAVTVSGEMNRIIGDIESGKTPVWAAGAMRNAMAQLNARGLSASSLAGQAMIQTLMESALPIAQMDATNKQAVAVESARQRAAFLNQEFTQEFETKVRNASTISQIANMNFSAEQQIALENSKMAQTMNLANLGNKQAIVMAEAAQIANLEMASLNNRQQAQVQNAQNFLAMDMANLNNAQATEIFKAQSMANTILSDSAAANANAQFNASSINQGNQFFSQLQSSLNQFNSAQMNAMKQFNASEANSISKFNSELQSAREQFNATMYAQIAQANAKWRQDVTTTNNAMLNQSNFQYAKDVNGLTNKVMDQIWQRERDIMSFAFTGSENAMERTTRLLLGDKTLQGIREQANANENIAKTSFAARLLFGSAGLPFSDGGLFDWFFPKAETTTTGE